MPRDTHDKMMAAIDERLKQLEGRLSKPEITPGRDPMDYSRREALSICFGANLSEAETELLSGEPETWTRLRRKLAAAEAFSLAVRSDGDVAAAHNAEVEVRLSNLFWLKDWRNRVRAQETARIRAHYQKPLDQNLWGE